MSSLHDPTENHLLGALPATALHRLRPHFDLVHLGRGQVVRAQGQRSTHLFFPISCIISLVYLLGSGDTAEIAIVGNEGVIGFPLFMSDGIAHSRAIVQHAGNAYTLSGNVLDEEFYRGRDLQKILLRYMQALFTQTAQTAICNRHHAIERQLARWLLMIQDRLPSNEIRMTQELIAEMLGVRREGVTLAALKLRDAGAITYQRGHIVVKDRSGLEGASCECYEAVRKEYDRLLQA